MAAASVNCAARVMLRCRSSASLRSSSSCTSSSSASALSARVVGGQGTAAAAAAAACPHQSRLRGLGGRIHSHSSGSQRIAAAAVGARATPWQPSSSSVVVTRFVAAAAAGRKTTTTTTTTTTKATPDDGAAQVGGAGGGGGGADDVGGGSVDSIRIVSLQGADVGALSDVLLSLGATCCSVEDADLGTDDEKELYAGDEKVWHRCNVTAMFAPDSDIAGIMSDAGDILQAEMNYVIETIPDNDWVNVVLDSFTPTKVLDGLWIVPEWCEKPAEDPDALSVVLEPGWGGAS